MTTPDPIMSTVGRAIGLGHRGDREQARHLLHQAWEQVGEDGDAMHRIGIAHSMADLQDEPAEELRWDQRALLAADELSDERVAAAVIDGPAAGFYPSLHLNLGEAYRKLGRFDQAAQHRAAGLSAAHALGWVAEPPDGYQAMVLDGFDRLGQRLDAATGG